MRALLILNPTAGVDEADAEKVSAIQAWLARGAFAAEVAYTSPERSAAQLAREAVAAGMEIVLAAGGDGTVSEVARELVNKSATLGVLPIGTFNNIARSLGILPDLPSACSIITTGHTREIDVGLANEEHLFLEAAGVGIDATLFPLGEEIKNGRWSRIVQAARLTFQYAAPEFEISFDRPAGEAALPPHLQRLGTRERTARRINRRALLVVVANGPYYGSGFTVAPAAKLSDGCLTVSIYRNFSKWELLRHFRAIALGRHQHSPKVETYATGEVRISSRSPLPVHVDGRPLGQTPITLRTLPKALRVFAPERPVQAPDENPPVDLPAEGEMEVGTDDRTKEPLHHV